MYILLSDKWVLLCENNFTSVTLVLQKHKSLGCVYVFVKSNDRIKEYHIDIEKNFLYIFVAVAVVVINIIIIIDALVS